MSYTHLTNLAQHLKEYGRAVVAYLVALAQSK